MTRSIQNAVEAAVTERDKELAAIVEAVEALPPIPPASSLSDAITIAILRGAVVSASRLSFQIPLIQRQIRREAIALENSNPRDVVRIKIPR